MSITPKQIRERADLVKKIVKHHFGVSPRKLTYKPAGMTNSVFEVRSSAGEHIVRLGEKAGKLQDYVKEQWVTAQVCDVGIPVAEILEVGDELISKPYMLQKKINGQSGTHHRERSKILRELGAYAKLINSIPTKGFGNVFDWSKNVLSKNSTWKDFLLSEMNAYDKLRILESRKVLEPKHVQEVKRFIGKALKWKNLKTHLNHGDLRLKNVIVDDEGKILAVIDWEDSCSNLAPVWELSIALHDLSVDEKDEFLKGYKISGREIRQMIATMKVLNTLNYAQAVGGLDPKRDKALLELYRLRLNGHLDLYLPW